MFNKLIASVLPYFPKKFIWIFSKRYIAGETMEEAIRVSHALNASGVWVTVDLLGEFITNLDQALENKLLYAQIIEKFCQEPLNVTFSLKPTSFGLLLDFEVCYQYVREVVAKAAELGHLIRIDMEDSSCVDKEIELYKRLHMEFPQSVGFVIQAYLKRTDGDIEDLVKWNSVQRPVNIRLCKGIYKESSSNAYKGRDQINRKYLENLETLLKNGIYTGIATHDKVLVNGARDLIKKYKLTNKEYEFQMLYGVTPELRGEIVSQGHPMRVYTPFGKEWFGYSTRRLKENPDMAGHIIKALFVRG